MAKSIASRIEWCRRQSTQACAPRELAGWQAEEEGLRDALFNRDHTNQYQQGPPCLFERYVMGLVTPASQAGTGGNAGTYGMGDVSTRHMLGIKRRGETYLQERRVTGNDK